MVALPSGIRPDLTLEDREVKRQLGKYRPRAYSNLIRSDIPDSSGVSPYCSPHSRSLSLPAMETSPGGASCCEANLGRTSGSCLVVGEEEEKRKAQG